MISSIYYCLFFLIICFVSRKSLIYASESNQLNVMPIIGVYAQPSSYKGEYIAASYVKWIESAGGRVIPIPYNASTIEIQAIFTKINGVLFPGGGSEVNEKAEYLYQLATKANDQGNYFPIWGTCLGMEWMLQMTSKNLEILDHDLDAMNLSLPLLFTKKAKASKLFRNAPDEIIQVLSKRNLTMNNHENGITPHDFYAHPKLSKFYDVLATDYDRNHEYFVSVIEAKKYPYYGVQFHPEKNAFEWGKNVDGTMYEVIDHHPNAIRVTQYFSNFFVSEARKNTLHRFKDPELEKNALIYNYQTYTITYPDFVQSYLFKTDSYTSLIQEKTTY